MAGHQFVRDKHYLALEAPTGRLQCMHYELIDGMISLHGPTTVFVEIFKRCLEKHTMPFCEEVAPGEVSSSLVDLTLSFSLEMPLITGHY